MKIVILCGGLGTRLSEETKVKPKPMVKIGKLPILQHIMNIYNFFGYNNFILALGYKGDYIRQYYKNNKKFSNINLINTGLKTMTGGRLLRLKNYFKFNETFMLTYGDGVSDINIKKLLKFHYSHKRIATITAVRPPVRFGELKFRNNIVKEFKEKPQSNSGWINGGFFVFNSKIFDLIKNDQTMLEREPMEKLASLRQLVAYKHKGYWQCMDTLRDKYLLNKLWKSGRAPWRHNLK